ncbi:MAG: 2-amino-4-hydroxy-6-hydroxymethyldihydropteridine diphosphokinase [Muribaculaceae bacterium]|nr:2-amino-4-hydroxy-6-hydroxymethyldihydropteridine diphosphokinase [Muribaculaceae bacterium]
MSEICISIGSNCGDRAGNVEKAIAWLATQLRCLKESDIYETPEVYGRGTPYFNCVAIGETSLSSDEINSLCKEYEVSCGRDAEARLRGEVVIDIDVVIFDGEVLRPVDFSREFFKIGYDQIQG